MFCPAQAAGFECSLHSAEGGITRVYHQPGLLHTTQLLGASWTRVLPGLGACILDSHVVQFHRDWTATSSHGVVSSRLCPALEIYLHPFPQPWSGRVEGTCLLGVGMLTQGLSARADREPAQGRGPPAGAAEPWETQSLSHPRGSLSALPLFPHGSGSAPQFPHQCRG